MRVAITADLHLTSRDKAPYRYLALEDILSQMVEMHIETILFAGDIFDASLRNYSEFDALCRDPRYRHLHFHLIPGNHDLSLTRAAIAADNVTVYSLPTVVRLGTEGRSFLLLPYEANRTMGERLAEHGTPLSGQAWILVGHGDYTRDRRSRDDHEEGVYMPLTAHDVELFRPSKVILGHIHVPSDQEPVYYTGSPCGHDITETGRRRFLVYDTETQAIQSFCVNTPVIYFDETIMVIPDENEAHYVREIIRARIAAWGLSEAEASRTQVRVKAKGYALDRQRTKQTLIEGFAGFKFYGNGGPDDTELRLADGGARANIAQAVKQWLDGPEWPWPVTEDEPTRDEILWAALNLIYGA